MSDCVIVQYCPLDTTIGRFARTRLDCDNFNNEFMDQCRVSDPFCKYIVMILENNNLKTPDDIREMCKETIRRLHE